MLIPFFFLKVYDFLDFSFRSFVEENSFFLFTKKESFLVVLLGFFLLFILFLIKKFTNDIKSAIRPIKF